MAKINVVTTEKACEILGCSRMWFYTTHKQHLTPIKEKLKLKKLYYEHEVLELKENMGANKKYNIIEASSVKKSSKKLDDKEDLRIRNIEVISPETVKP